MKKEEDLTQYLNGIYQNTRTAIQSLKDIIPKTKNKKLKQELFEQKSQYTEIMKKCEMFATKNNLHKLKDNRIFEKLRLYISINMSTFNDKSARKISQLVLFGTFMGIITCIKDSYDHKNISEELDKILNELKELEKSNIDKLIPYLA